MLRIDYQSPLTCKTFSFPWIFQSKSLCALVQNPSRTAMIINLTPASSTHKFILTPLPLTFLNLCFHSHQKRFSSSVFAPLRRPTS